MKLIIDIQDFVYNNVKEFDTTHNYELNIVESIKNGTPLEEQKTGHWILRDEWFDDEEKPRLAYGCDRCGFSLKNTHEKRWFCPNCGAKMEKENKQ